jgi:hypothetical protein
MIGRSAGIFAASALGATALILPPGIAPASSDDDASLPSIVNPKNQLIQLPCPACAFSPNEELTEKKDFDDLLWIQGGANDVVLNFTVSDDGLALELGGKAVYAPSCQTNALLSGERLYVHQVPATVDDIESDSDESRKVPLEITAVGLSTEAEVRASPEGDVIVQLQLHIMGLEGHFMQFDGVRIHLLKSSDGEFLILRLDVVRDSSFTPFHGMPALPPHSPSRPTLQVPDMKSCKSLPTAFCKFREMIEAKIDSMRQSHPDSRPPLPNLNGLPPPHMPPSINSHNLDFDAPPPHHHGRPHHVRPYGEHHHSSHFGFHSIARSVISVLIPVMAGITVGLLVSLLGLLVGRMVGFVWLRIYPNHHRRRHGRHTRRSRRHYAVDEGKILLCEDDCEPLPRYEDAPAYEEIETRPPK